MVKEMIIEIPMKLREVEEVLQREVSKRGNSGHIPIPKKHIGKEVMVAIFKKEKEELGK